MNLLAISSVLSGMANIFGGIGSLKKKEYSKSIPYLIGIITFVVFLVKYFSSKNKATH